MFGIFLTITSEDILILLGHVGDLFSDLKILLWVVVGIALGLIIFRAIIDAIT